MKKNNYLLQQIGLVMLVLFGTILSSSQLSAQLKYGDVIHLQNGWNNYKGGFLDTKGFQKDFEKTGNYLCVSTATKSDRDGGSGSWVITSASGKPNGSPVLFNDDIYLLNKWQNNGGYLDTKGFQKDFEKTGNHLCVSTAKVSKRDGGSGTWKILSKSGGGAGSPVTVNSEIMLQNGWNRFTGGYLDTRGFQKDWEKTGNLLCVSTTLKSSIHAGTVWRITK
jgi:hypothetical protein